MSPANTLRGFRWLARISLGRGSAEAAVCARLFALHFLILAFQYAVKAVRQSVYVDVLGAERLPLVYLAAALASWPVLALYGRLIDRWPVRRLLVGSSLFVGLGTVAFWGVFRGPGPAVAVAFYLWTAVTGILLVSQLWSYAGERLDPRQARRRFAFVGAGGILGSIVGGQVARLASGWSGTRDTLLVAALALVAAAVLLGFRDKPGAAGVRPIAGTRDTRGGLGLLRHSRAVRWMAALMLLSAMVGQVIDLQFSWAVERSTVSLDERTALFGNLYSLVGLAAFAFQLLLTSRIHSRLGTGFAMRVLPVSNGLGSVALIAAAIFAPAWVLVAAWALKTADNGLRYSLDQATRELLFLPLPGAERRRAKAFVDVFVQRAAKATAAILLLAVPLGWVSVVDTAWVTVVLVVLWLLASAAAQRSYVAAFREGLTKGPSAVGASGVADAATLELLVEGLGAPDPRLVLRSIELLASQGRGRLVHPFLVHHPEPEVRCRVLELLAAEGRRDALPLVDRLLADDEPSVRLAAVRTLARLEPAGLVERLLEHLDDPDPRVRASAIGWLGQHERRRVRERAERALLEMLGDGSAPVRIAAAQALGELAEPAHQGALVRLLYDADPEVVRAAIRAVRARKEGNPKPAPLYIAILVSNLRHRKLKHDARRALVAYGESVVPALAHFMVDEDEDLWVRRAIPKTLAAIGGRSAAAALALNLAAPDSFLRRKVVQALVSLRAQGAPGPAPAAVEVQLTEEVRGYLRTLGDLASLRPLRLRGPLVDWSGDGRPHLLERLLADRMNGHLENAFGLLALLRDPRAMRAALRGLRSERQEVRAHALEYLDNVLTGDVRRAVFAMIDEIPVAERLTRARRLFDLRPGPRASTLQRLVRHRATGDADAVWLSAAALHYAADRKLAAARTLLEAAADDPAPEVRETTALLHGQLSADIVDPV